MDPNLEHFNDSSPCIKFSLLMVTFDLVSDASSAIWGSRASMKSLILQHVFICWVQSFQVVKSMMEE